jgi:hypothetical protein
LELPYKGGDISLFVILPPFNKQRGIIMLTKRLNTNILQDIVASNEWRSRTVEVSLPKFNIEQSMDNLVPVSVFIFILCGRAVAKPCRAYLLSQRDSDCLVGVFYISLYPGNFLIHETKDRVPRDVSYRAPCAPYQLTVDMLTL